MGEDNQKPVLGWIWDLKRYALHDGPGIRTTVFFKGCPLRCPWCCNPESQSFDPEISWLGENCLGCNRCLETCPRGAIEFRDGVRRIDMAGCDLCGRCVDACPGRALVQVGRLTSVSELLCEVVRDGVFFQRSGGGLTLSGGEPAVQPLFARELLRRYKTEEYGLHTALETCGYAPWEDLAGVLEYTDLVLYDIKIMDPRGHQQATGVDNRLILDNARRIAATGKSLVIRLPLIPGHTDSEENVAAIAAYARELPGVEEIHLLPYHRLGEPKYRRLGRPYALEAVATYPRARAAALADLVRGAGLCAQVGG
jgi:pyruvate formate lyase activating enzyme